MLANWVANQCIIRRLDKTSLFYPNNPRRHQKEKEKKLCCYPCWYHAGISLGAFVAENVLRVQQKQWERYW
jgi:hypothetical protein